MTKKSKKKKKKIKYLQNEKRFKRAFKGLPLKQIKQFFFGSESPTLKEKIWQDVKRVRSILATET